MDKKVVLVTGASRGVGRRIAMRLAECNYIVIANYNKSESKAKELEKYAVESGFDLTIYKADVTNRKEVKKMMDYIINTYKKIDVVVNNAGIARARMFDEINDEDIEYVMQGNYASVLRVAQEAYPYMKDKKSGCIINISSIFGMTGAEGAVLYASSKAAVDALTKSLAKEIGKYNIRVNSIAPGVMNTDLNKSLTDADWRNVKKGSPLNRITDPNDIAKCVLWLIEDTSTTGQVISINSGTTII